MLEVVPTKPFKRDLKKYQHKKDMVKELYEVISTLTREEPLDPKKKDHNLVGNYVNYRECHVKNDVLSYLRTDFPRKPNKETLKAHQEALNGGGVDCDSLEDFWEQMGVKPSAFDLLG